jgi:WD40 repeat protein
MRVWDVEHGQCIRVLQGYTSALYDIDWSPNGMQIASGGADALVTIWDATGASTPRNVIRGHSWVVFGVAWSPDGRSLASSGWDTFIHLWNPTTGTEIEQQHIPNTFLYGLAWSADGKRLFCGTYLQGVLRWEIAAHSYSWVEPRPPARFLRVALSPDGTHLASGNSNGHVYLWDVATGNILHTLAHHPGSVMSVVWKPDGTQLASGGLGGISVWNAHSGERIQTLTGSSTLTSALCWGTSGERADLLVSGDRDGELRWWNVQNGACLWRCKAHQGMVQSLKVSPDGATLASCGDDGAIMLWDLHSGEHLCTLRRDRPYERLNITGIKGLSEEQKSTLCALGAIEHESSPGIQYAQR